MPSFQHVQEFITYALFLETFNNIFCQLTLLGNGQQYGMTQLSENPASSP
jgi:hypothetical protein